MQQERLCGRRVEVKHILFHNGEKRTIFWELNLFSLSGEMVGRHVDSWVKQKEMFLITLVSAGYVV